jgi:quinol monooxygenase YgiN
MKQFFVSRVTDNPNVFLYTQIFISADAHQAHIEGNDPKNFFAQMEEEGFQFQGRWVAGKEIDSAPEGQWLN